MAAFKGVRSPEQNFRNDGLCTYRSGLEVKMASKHIKRPPSAHSLKSEKHKRDRKNDDEMTETDLAEPKNLLRGSGVTLRADPDVQSLINSNGTWLVTWIGRHRTMAHLHEFDFLELC